MSQGDYIKYKRVQRELSELRDTPKKIPSIIDSGNYISYKKFSLGNTILNDNDEYFKLIPTDVPIVFGMEIKCASSRPYFTLCRGTDQRQNRHLNPIGEDDLPTFRFPTNSSIPKWKKMRWNTINKYNKCQCNNM